MRFFLENPNPQFVLCFKCFRRVNTALCLINSIIFKRKRKSSQKNSRPTVLTSIYSEKVKLSCQLTRCLVVILDNATKKNFLKPQLHSTCSCHKKMFSSNYNCTLHVQASLPPKRMFSCDHKNVLI